MTMPITPTTTTQASRMPNRAPVSLFAMRSPMSTKPPNAVSTPRNTSKILFIDASLHRGRERVEVRGEVLQRRRRLLERRDVAPAGRDPHQFDHVDDPLHVGQDACPQLVGCGVGRD